MSKNKQERIVVNVMTVEWSDSPVNRGMFDVFLSYNRWRKLWSLYSRPGGGRGVFASRRGTPEEDLRTVALELVREACRYGSLEFESIIHEGPFRLTLQDLARREYET